MLEDWHLRFPDCEPIGYRLRHAFQARWVRFHSLPVSKRYAENEDEYGIVLKRMNSVLGQLLGKEHMVVLLTTGYSESTDVVMPPAELGLIYCDVKPWWSVPMLDLDGFTYPSYWHVFASECEWQPGVFDQIFRLIADNVVRNVMVVDPNCHWLFAPYDGGMDVILETTVERDRLRDSRSDWLSLRPDGL